MDDHENDEARESDAEDIRDERSWIAEQTALILVEDGFQST